MLESSQQRLLIHGTIAIVIGHGSTKKKRPQEWASSFLSSSISSHIFLSSSQPHHIRFRDFYSARFLSFFPPFISLYLTVLFHPARFLRSRDLLSRGSREAGYSLGSFPLSPVKRGPGRGGTQWPGAYTISGPFVLFLTVSDIFCPTKRQQGNHEFHEKVDGRLLHPATYRPKYNYVE